MVEARGDGLDAGRERRRRRRDARRAPAVAAPGVGGAAGERGAERRARGGAAQLIAACGAAGLPAVRARRRAPRRSAPEAPWRPAPRRAGETAADGASPRRRIRRRGDDAVRGASRAPRRLISRRDFLARSVSFTSIVRADRRFRHRTRRVRSAVRPEREARRGREHPRHVRPPRARRVRPVPASRNYKTVPLRGCKEKLSPQNLLGASGAARRCAPEAQACERALLRDASRPGSEALAPSLGKRRQSLDVCEGEDVLARRARRARVLWRITRPSPRPSRPARDVPGRTRTARGRCARRRPLVPAPRGAHRARGGGASEGKARAPRRRGGRARGGRCARGAVCLSRTSRRWWRTWSASTREARGARESPRRSVGYADARGTSDRCDWKCTLSVDYKTTVVPGSIRCSAYSPASWRAPVAPPPPTPCRPDSCSPRRPSSRPPPTATPVASASSRGWIRCA